VLILEVTKDTHTHLKNTHLSTPLLATTCYTPYIPPYDDKGAASTCKPAEQQNKPEAPVWLPTFWACMAQKTWFEPMISSKEIKIQQT